MSLPDDIKLFIVQHLACYDTPSEVAKAVKEEYDIAVTRQSVEAYDPNKKAGQGLSQAYRDLFAATRKAFIEETADIPVAHRAYRLRRLGRMASLAETMRNYGLAAQLLEQAAKETGGSYTNKQRLEHTGKDGAPIEASVATRPDLSALNQIGRDGLRAALEQLVRQPGGDAPGA